jgi:hypothetical protein
MEQNDESIAQGERTSTQCDDGEILILGERQY